MTEETDDYLAQIVDAEALASYLEKHLGPAETYEIERHPQGHSNETLFVTWGQQVLVIRRPPPGEYAEGAHDVLREYRVMAALKETTVPVPPTVLACENRSILGSEFYVMERIEGDVLHVEEIDRFATPEYRRRIGEEVVDRLADIHTVDYASIGLDEFGYPEGFTDRQVELWADQLSWAREVTSQEREVQTLTEVGDWLDRNTPNSHPHTLVHGDYKLDNVMFAPRTPPRIDAIFDWEMSTLGDPLTDLGFLLTFWWEDSDGDPPGIDLYPAFTAREGYPTRRELVDRYESRTGFEFENHRFYRALAMYKTASLCEMMYRRYLTEGADDPIYALMDEGVPRLANRAMRIIEDDEQL